MTAMKVLTRIKRAIMIWGSEDGRRGLSPVQAEILAALETLQGGDLPLRLQDDLTPADPFEHQVWQVLHRIARERAAQHVRVRQMAENLRGTSSEKSDRVHQQADVLARYVEETVTAIEEILASIRQIAGSTEELAAAATATAQSMAAMGTSTQQIWSNAGEAMVLTDAMLNDVESGSRTVDETAESMGRIKESIDVATDAIRQWEKRSEEVGSITEVIEEIVDRTNLLGLNAAIQAAQAGSYGSAFGVVASEIRKLAEQTRVSTTQIDELIKTVRHEMAETVKHVLAVSERAADGVRRSERAAASLREIRQQIGKVSVQVRAIAEATGLQTGEARSVLSTVELFRQRTQEISDATLEQVHTGEPISKRGLQMSKLAEEVKGAMAEQAEASRRIADEVKALADLSTTEAISDG